MSGLVGYASSDEEDEIRPERPAKIAKTDAHRAGRTTAESQPAANATTEPIPPATAIQRKDATAPSPSPAATPSGIPGPSAPAPAPQPEVNDDHSNTPPLSPYSLERTALRNLTMPTHPNFSIPPSPSPPPQNSEAAATLSTTTKKFDRFLELKKQGVHFNARLENSSALRNPGLLPKLMAFAGISEEESHASTLGLESGGVPTRWPEEWYVENLVKENERREKRAKGARTEVGFVKARSGASSATSTPKGGAGGGSEHRKARVERR